MAVLLFPIPCEPSTARSGVPAASSERIQAPTRRMGPVSRTRGLSDCSSKGDCFSAKKSR
jgi:hypothetical protein